MRVDMSLSRGVLVATDGTESAMRAEAVAAAIAAGCKCKLVVVTISSHLPTDELRRLARTAGNIEAAEKQLAAQILEQATERASRAGIADIKQVCEEADDAADAIVDIATREQVDLIVMGKRGVGLLSQLLIGSVSKSLVDVAPCAVTVVP